MTWYLILLFAVGIERLAELVLAQRNLAWSRARGGVEIGAGHYPVMVALHLALLVGCVSGVLPPLSAADATPTWHTNPMWSLPPPSHPIAGSPARGR